MCRPKRLFSAEAAAERAALALFRFSEKVAFPAAEANLLLFACEFRSRPLPPYAHGASFCPTCDASVVFLKSEEENLQVKKRDVRTSLSYRQPHKKLSVSDQKQVIVA